MGKTGKDQKSSLFEKMMHPHQSYGGMQQMLQEKR